MFLRMMQTETFPSPPYLSFPDTQINMLGLYIALDMEREVSLTVRFIQSVMEHLNFGKFSSVAATPFPPLTTFIPS
jgi:hypothetical protein